MAPASSAESSSSTGSPPQHQAEEDEHHARDSVSPMSYIPTSQMDGVNVRVNDDGSIYLRWMKSDHEKMVIRLVCKYAIPATAAEIQALSFHEHGIDIVDGSGTAFLETQAINAAAPRATWAWETLKATRTGDKAFELWKAVRTHQGHAVPSEVQPNARMWNFTKDDGVGFLSGQAQKMKPPQNVPPREEDASFLLHTWLNERFPDGGNLRTAENPPIAESTMDLQDFVRFLRTPEYNGHPWAAVWIGRLTKTRPEVAVLGKNLPLYRRCVQHKTSHVLPRAEGVLYKDAKQLGETWFELGPPGTSSDPFAEARGRIKGDAEPKNKSRVRKASPSSSSNTGKRKSDDAAPGEEQGEGKGKKRARAEEGAGEVIQGKGKSKKSTC